MKKIAYISSLLRVSFCVYFAWIIISFLGSWIMFKYPTTKPAGLSISFHNAPSASNLSSLPNIFTMNAPLAWKIVYSIESIMIFGLYLLFASNAVRLFGLYKRNVIFDLRCVTLIKKTGLILFFINFIQFIFPAINAYLLSNQRRDIPEALSFGTDQATIFVISLLLIATSWIMEESYKIHDEQRHTV
ncbi:MAG: hypothetical protein H0T84_03835 [Tatlockia sp.]|nr:hypothetical protein [Tatlockia sp.]